MSADRKRDEEDADADEVLGHGGLLSKETDMVGLLLLTLVLAEEKVNVEGAARVVLQLLSEQESRGPVAIH